MKKFLSFITSLCLCSMSLLTVPVKATGLAEDNVKSAVSILSANAASDNVISADYSESAVTTVTTTTTTGSVPVVTTVTTVPTAPNSSFKMSYEGEEITSGKNFFVPFDTDVTVDFESKGDVEVSDYILETEDYGNKLDIDNSGKTITLNIADGNAVKAELHDIGSDEYFILTVYGKREYDPPVATTTTQDPTVTTAVIGMVDHISGTVSIENIPTKRVYSTSDTQVDLSGGSVKIDLDRSLFAYSAKDSIFADMTDMPFSTDVLQIGINHNSAGDPYKCEKLHLNTDTSAVDFSTPGTYPVTVNAIVEKIPATMETVYEDLELSTSFDIVVQDPTTTSPMCSDLSASVYIKSLPDKLDYKVGSTAVDLSGGVMDIYVTPTFPDGNSFYFDCFNYDMTKLPYVSTVPVTEDHSQQAEVRAWADTSSVDFSAPGTYPVYITITVPELDYEKKVTFDVTVSEIITGDANGDDEISVSDPVLISQHLANTDEYPMTAAQRDAADIVGGGDGLTSADALQLQRYLAGLIDDISDVPEDIKLEKANILTAELERNTVEGLAPDADFINAQNEFAVNMFKSCYGGENTIVSPYSAMEVLSMTANGAKGSTRSQMESALGGLSIDSLNRYLYTFRNTFPTGDRVNVRVANSIWERTGSIDIAPDFLQNVVDYYGAEVAEAPFDETTVRDINSWISGKTDGQIDKMIDEIDSETMMYLINTVLLDAKWEERYFENSAYSGDFTAADGTVQTAQYLGGAESVYLEDSEATGFIKYYEGRKLGFAAILPNEDISIDEYVSGLTGEKLTALLQGRKNESVETKLPKFEYDSRYELAETLEAMGMTDAFSSVLADFGGIGECKYGNLYISNVIQKAHIDLNEEGTTAAAATIVIMACGAVIPEHEVSLDRPFVYAIIDMETNVPLFMGAVTNIG